MTGALLYFISAYGMARCIDVFAARHRRTDPWGRP